MVGSVVTAVSKVAAMVEVYMVGEETAVDAVEAVEVA
jgi:hypothetical protein